jgi:anti-sigma regulatory factor (Ser/Thr protein kinase)
MALDLSLLKSERASVYHALCRAISETDRNPAVACFVLGVELNAISAEWKNNMGTLETASKKDIVEKYRDLSANLELNRIAYAGYTPRDVRAFVDDFVAVVKALEETRAAAGQGGAAATRRLDWSPGKPSVELSFQLLDRYEYHVVMKESVGVALEKEFGWKGPAHSLACFAINELVENAFEHGCRGMGEKRVWLGLEVKGDLLVVTVRDQGEGFDLAAVLAKAQKGCGPAAVRGRGLKIIREISSELVSADGGRLVRAVLDRRFLANRRVSRLPIVPGKARPGRPAAGPAGPLVPVDPGAVFVNPTLGQLMAELGQSDEY